MKIAVIPYGKKIVVSGKGQIEKPEGYELESRTEGRDGTKLVLVSSLYGIIDRWSEAHRVFGVFPVIEPIDVYVQSGFIVLPVLSQGLSFEKLPAELDYILQWISFYNDYRVRKEDGKWYFTDCPVVRLGLEELFEKFWFFFGDRPSFNAEREIEREFLSDYPERKEEVSPIVRLAEIKRSPENDEILWEPGPLFDFRWSN